MITRQVLALIAVLFLQFYSHDASALNCNISMPDVAFGAIDSLSGNVTDVSSSIQVDCSEFLFGIVDSTIGVCLYLDEGSGGSDGTTYRNMVQGSDDLPFNLYKDAARTQIWGSESAFPAAGAQRVVVTLNGVLGLLATGSATVPVYGRVPGSISGLPIGPYASTFAGGARARYSFNNAIPCDGVNGSQTSDSFLASGTIIESCAVEADDLDFGAHARLDGSVDGSSQIRLQCSADTAYSVSLGAGGGGDAGARRMVHGSIPTEQIGYQLYSDASRSQVWGDGSGSTTTVGGTGTGATQSVSVYGRIPLQATPRPGDYVDTVIVTVNY
ncbi:MAG: spore coat U domain-containing protein [Woeseia sp.]